MIRGDGLREINRVTRVAVCRCAFELTVLMARGTVCRDVRTEQDEVCLFMVERGRLPHGHRVACRAVVRELTRHVIRSDGLREISRMARVAVCRRTFELTVLMAGCTVSRDVRAEQGKICFLVVERRRLPHGHRMASRAVV
jgi:hypothetical protein